MFLLLDWYTAYFELLYHPYVNTVDEYLAWHFKHVVLKSLEK